MNIQQEKVTKWWTKNGKTSRHFVQKHVPQKIKQKKNEAASTIKGHPRCYANPKRVKHVSHVSNGDSIGFTGVKYAPITTSVESPKSGRIFVSHWAPNCIRPKSDTEWESGKLGRWCFFFNQLTDGTAAGTLGSRHLWKHASHGRKLTDRSWIPLIIFQLFLRKIWIYITFVYLLVHVLANPFWALSSRRIKNIVDVRGGVPCQRPPTQ